jgi:hypothetical protein
MSNIKEHQIIDFYLDIIHPYLHTVTAIDG